MSLRDTSPGHSDPVPTPSLRITGNFQCPLCSLPHQAAPGGRAGQGTRARSHLSPDHGRMLHPGGFALALPPSLLGQQRIPRAWGQESLTQCPRSLSRCRFPGGSSWEWALSKHHWSGSQVPGPGCTPGDTKPFTGAAPVPTPVPQYKNPSPGGQAGLGMGRRGGGRGGSSHGEQHEAGGA